MANCDSKLSANITHDACKPATKGMKPLGWIANFEDIDHDDTQNTRAEGTNLLTDIILYEGTKMYKIYQSGKTPFSGATSEAQVGTYRTTWNKTLPFVILKNGADVTANIIDKMANGRFVAVVENSYAGNDGDNAFEVLGLETGLTLSEGNNEKYNEDYGGGWSLTMVEENAPTSGLYILKTDVETTRALLDSKCTA